MITSRFHIFQCVGVKIPSYKVISLVLATVTHSLIQGINDLENNSLGHGKPGNRAHRIRTGIQNSLSPDHGYVLTSVHWIIKPARGKGLGNGYGRRPGIPVQLLNEMGGMMKGHVHLSGLYQIAAEIDHGPHYRLFC